MILYTIGCAGTTAERFFARLREAGVRTVYDTRRHRTGQLSGFAKMPDFQFFLRALTGAEYVAASSLAPSADLLQRYRRKDISWSEYASAYEASLVERDVGRHFPPESLDRGCLLCSEPEPSRCHRRLAADYLRLAAGSNGTVVHL